MSTFVDTSVDQGINSHFFDPKASNETMGRDLSSPVQAVGPTPAQTSWFTTRPGATRPTKEQEKNSYFLSPLWRDTFGSKPSADSIQEIEIFDNVQLVDFFPSFENSAFRDLALENCILSYYPREIEKNAPGLYFRTDLILGGLLDGPLEFFKMFLSDSDIVIRLSAFLGFTLDHNKPLHFDNLTLAGCLGGLRVSYPPGNVLLEIVSAGMRITFENNKNKKDGQKRPPPESGEMSDPKKLKTETGSSSAPADTPDIPPKPKPSVSSTISKIADLTDPNKLIGVGSAALTHPSGPVTTGTNPQPDTTHDKGKSSFTAKIFGNILLHLYIGRVVPLQLEYTAQYSPENIHFDMVLSEGKSWDHAFGIENFELKDIVITADIPTKNANKAFGKMAEKAALDDGFACKIEGSWNMGFKDLSLKGEIYSSTKTQANSSYIEAVLTGPTFNDIRQAAKKLHDYEVPEPKQDIRLDSMRLRIDFSGKFAFYGMITVDGATFEASIIISSGGIFISGKAQKFQIPETDFYIREASLDLFIARRSENLPEDGKGQQTAANGNDEGVEGGHEAKETSKETKKSDKTDIKLIPKSAGKTSMDEAKRNDSLSAVPGKKAATDTKCTDTPATTADAGSGSDQKPKKEVSWFFGFKVYGILVLPYGPKDLDGDYKFKFAVTFTVSKSPTKGVEVLLAGKARSTVSLRDICGDAIKKDSLLDAQLSDLTFMGTNSDNPDVPPEISRFPIKKGFYLCATLDRVPILEDKDQKDGGKVLKKSTATDRAYLRIGYQKGDKIPKITIFLPPSFKVEFGDRFYSGAIFLELDAESDPICKFHGELYMKVDEPGKKPIKFILEIAADHIGGSIGMKIDALDGIKGPLGFSDRFVVYSLQGRVSAKWAMLLSTGALESFGLGGRFTIEEDSYTCEMQLGTNPTQTLVNIKANALGVPQLCKFISAVADEDMPVPDVDFINIRDLDIYVSRGCTWLDTYYPKGFKFKGIIKLWDLEASMDAELNSIGFHCLTKIKGFELGPLKLSGALEGEEGASMEITLNPIKQSFYLSGRIEIFEVSCACFVDCQFMPSPKFVFDFELKWSAGLLVKVHAEMHQRRKTESGKKDIATGKELKGHPGGSDWEIYALMEQSIIAQVKQGILSAVDNTHKAMEKGIKSAMDDVERQKENWERDCREAKERLDAAHKKLQEEIDRLDREIEEAQDNVEKVKQRNEKYTSDERAKCSGKQAQAEKDRAARLEPKAAARRSADEDKENQERNREWKMQEARNKRTNTRDSFFSKFGNASAVIDNALRDLNNAEREVNRLSWEADRLEDRISHEWWRVDLEAEYLAKRNAWAFARGGLLVYEGILRGAREIVDSPLFRQLKEAMEAAEQYLNTVGDQIRSALETAGRIASLAFDELQRTIREEDFNFDSLMKHANSLVADVEKECQKYEEEARARSIVLDKQKQKMASEFKQVGYVALEEAVEFARKNNIALLAAEKALAAFSALEKAAYNAIRDFVAATLDAMIDIQRIELKGIIRADESDQEAFHLSIKGRLGNKDFAVEESWMPNKTHIFLAKIGLHAVASITGSSMDQEIKALDEEMKNK